MRIATLLLGLACLLAPACSSTMGSNEAAPAGQRAIAVVHPTEGSSVRGWVSFEQMDGYVAIEAELTGLSPGEHGFHIHEWGDVNCADGTCTGGHFNPTGAPHAGPQASPRHAGDLGNVNADATGRALLTMKDSMIQLSGPDSIIGRAVIVHAEPDDLVSQPTGAAGARVAAGVIGIAPPAE